MPICSACHRHDLPCEGILLLQCDSHCFRTSRHHASKSLPIPFAAVCVQSPLSSLHEQDLTELNDLKAKVCRTGTAKLCAGLPHCSKLDGTNFYLYPRDRTLNCKIIVALVRQFRHAEQRLIQKPGAPGLNRMPTGKHGCKNARPPIRCQLRGGREPAFVPAKTERIGAAAITEHRFLPGSRETEEDW